MISRMFQRVVATPTRALCRQRHTISAVINGALPSTQSSASIRALSYSCRSYSSFIKSTPLAYRINTLDSILAKQGVQIRTFQSVGHYHNVADESLNSIQDVVEEYLEEHYVSDGSEKDEDIAEVNYASGVLTMYLPPHGSWVINKQTPNQQIWWSSPISGPKRYEYDEKRERWVYSRVMDGEGAADSDGVAHSEEDTLGGILNKEFEELFGEVLDDEFHC
mmetsp:Transcript_20044/g.43450  ORF Transcript_20044/g.43450 Transcript_20044/m.43450 type:complete len:221 (-) Transcript_20044:143-805(-)|eukprot:CAMPEP_0172318084 /NCGR_PEP_ID=MMETSP1058-20130122/33810_1 /TAXON_ID=83371 /ORGANISM="Detonula confervacea, Strain CCMP 353" /LENGTH=220 /DNA_ID=CAMNT_0013032813 /DNA_START=116 /DNA_END=778 /DNA_ORIENTATION=-